MTNKTAQARSFEINHKKVEFHTFMRASNLGAAVIHDTDRARGTVPARTIEYNTVRWFNLSETHVMFTEEAVVEAEILCRGDVNISEQTK